MPEDGFKTLRHVITDGETAESLAESYKRNGNEALKRGEKGYQLALLHYTAALALGCKDAKLSAVIHSNRAQASYKPFGL